MSHIKVRTDNIEIPYIDKIYITKDETSYISLNSGQIVYYENNEKKEYQFNMGKKPFKMLEYLIDNNGNFVKSETLYYDIFGLVESENQDSVVDQVRKDLWKISCIKNSDMKIKKHSFDVVVTSLETEESIYNLEYKNKIIVIGNEANGVSKEIQEIADKKVKIPMLGKTESLNASVATGIMVYEYVRGKVKKL